MDGLLGNGDRVQLAGMVRSPRNFVALRERGRMGIT